MPDSLRQFFVEHPVLAVILVVFMILPMMGAVLHIVLKALGRKGIDNSGPDEIDVSSDGKERENGVNQAPENRNSPK